MNLDADIVRRHFMECQLSKLSIPYERVSGIDGRILSKETLNKFSEVTALGAIGGFLTRFEIFQNIVNRYTSGNFIIFEDDSFLTRNLVQSLSSLNIPHDFDCINLCVHTRKRGTIVFGYSEIFLASQTLEENLPFNKIRANLGASAIVYSYRCVEKMLLLKEQLMKASPHIDVSVRSFFNNGLNCYFLRKNLTSHRSELGNTRSIIDSNFDKKIIDCFSCFKNISTRINNETFKGLDVTQICSSFNRLECTYEFVDHQLVFSFLFKNKKEIIFAKILISEIEQTIENQKIASDIQKKIKNMFEYHYFDKWYNIVKKQHV
jgi:hypothetical protein